MTKAELLRAYANEDRDDYGKKYLLPYWKEHHALGGDALTAGHFDAAHLNQNAMSSSSVKKMAKNRSNNAERNFTSTMMPDKHLVKITTYLYKNGAIQAHIQAGLIFRNYVVDVPIMANTFTVDASKGGGHSRTEMISPIVGINERGLINHFHGDAETNRGGAFIVSNNKNKNWVEM